jgi:hypothetical protein
LLNGVDVRGDRKQFIRGVNYNIDSDPEPLPLGLYNSVTQREKVRDEKYIASMFKAVRVYQVRVK